MTDDVRNLIRFVVDGDIRNAQTQCRIMLEKNVPEKDARFKENELRKLNLLKPELIQLPANLENLLIAEDATNFPESRFLLREEEETVINKLLATRKAALAIKELGIHYTCSLLLTGLPGVGKTELARYIAHKANLPFVFLKFSGLVNSALGRTQQNIGRVFDYAKRTPCVLCVDEIDAIGAGDQGIQFGYASNETEEYMPYAINMAHKLARQLTKIRKDGTLKYLRPDGKTQVTVEYDEAGKPSRIDAVVCSTQHDPDVTQEQIHEDIKKYVFDEIIPADMVDENTKYFINPTGRFVIGGPHGDSGLTGRKIIVDTYGGTGRHGGGAFSGKDCTKVDRSAAYAARYVAKNIVAAGLADKCEIQLSYAIGVAHPTSIHVETFGTGKLSDTKLVEIIRENFDLRPAGIIKMLDLRRPIYRQTAAYGHFGRTDVDLPWEHLDKVDDLKKYLA